MKITCLWTCNDMDFLISVASEDIHVYDMLKVNFDVYIQC